jgi:hypothetical protein
LTLLRPTQETDLPQLSRLFAQRFGHPLTAEEWRWKYRQIPGEGRSWVALGADGAVVAHAGALRLGARWRGGEGGIWQLVDFVAAPGGRGLRPPLVELGRRLLAGLPGEEDAPWIFGFPSERHFRLGERVFGYRPLATVEVLTGPLPEAEPAGAVTGAVEAAAGEAGAGTDTAAGAAAGAWRGAAGEAGAGSGAAAAAGARIESGDSGGAWAEEAWEACGSLGVRRGMDFLNWRYHARPGRYYRFYRLLPGGTGEGGGGAGARVGSAGGLAVFAFVGEDAWAAELWLPPSGEWYAPMLAVAADLRASGLRSWRFWPPPAPGGELLAALGVRPAGEHRSIGCRGRPGDPDPAAAAAGFYYAMGDYDLV